MSGAVEKEDGHTEQQGSEEQKDFTQRESEVEQLARRIEERRDARIPITFAVRKRLLQRCREIASKTDNHTRIPLENLVELRDQVKKEVDAQGSSSLLESLGFPNESKMLLQVLDRGVQRVQTEVKSDFFYFQDFSFYFTQLISYWPFLNNSLYLYVLILIAYYIMTPVFFCYIVDDENICPSDEKYGGWLSAMYFLSATISTVGYGDVNITGGDVETPRWRVFIGILFMIVSCIVLVTAVSAAMGSAGNPLDPLQDMLIQAFGGATSSKDKFLYQRIRRVRFVKLSIIAIEFFVLNLLGVFVARLFIRESDVEDEQWTWMMTLYWSVQTTTTIGYGDLTMPFELRWFQIFYLMISTYFVGDSLGRLSALNDEITEIRRQYAWSRREVSKGMLEDLQAEEHDDKIDQYEFIVASLLSLNKISSDDIIPVMEKFRVLAGSNGVISMDDQNTDEPDDLDEKDGQKEDELEAVY